jgi:peptide/histidine transporter 3/4
LLGPSKCTNQSIMLCLVIEISIESFKFLDLLKILVQQGLIMLTLSVTLDFFKPTPCSTASSFCPPATTTQVGFFYFSLYLMSFGSGSMKPCIAAFGADQFDEEDKNENQSKKSFFNWWVFGISIGGLISATVMVYIQDSVSWGWGFGVPTALLGLFLIAYIAGIPFYRHKAPMGSPITQIVQVMVAAARNWHVQLPADSGLLYEVCDKEALLMGRRPIPHSNTFRYRLHLITQY